MPRLTEKERFLLENPGAVRSSKLSIPGCVRRFHSSTMSGEAIWQAVRRVRLLTGGDTPHPTHKEHKISTEARRRVLEAAILHGPERAEELARETLARIDGSMRRASKQEALDHYHTLLENGLPTALRKQNANFVEVCALLSSTTDYADLATCVLEAWRLIAEQKVRSPYPLPRHVVKRVAELFGLDKARALAKACDPDDLYDQEPVRKPLSTAEVLLQRPPEEHDGQG